ncbi:MAG: MCE family protein [Planctomycetes bacterium]|nr:MCE family protein [Planctomycetota bacterium]
MNKSDEDEVVKPPHSPVQPGHQRQLLLGAFFIVALSILAYYTLFLTDSHLFSEPILMTVYFEEANNLREGDQVQLLGAKIGRVKEVTPNTSAKRSKRIRTVLSLEREVELLQDAVISIQETSLLGGRNVMIDPGTFGGPVLPPLEDGGGYLGKVQKNPIASFGDFGAELSKLVSENRESIKSSLANLTVITDDLRNGRGLLGKLVKDEQIVADVRTMLADARTFMANASEASAQLKNGQGLVGALLYDPVAKQKFSDTLDNLQRLSADLNGQDGVLGALIHDPALKESLTHGIDQFVAFGEKLNQGEGTLPMLLSDKATKEQVQTLIADFSATMSDVRGLVADVRAGKGSLGKALTDDTLYDNLAKASSVLTRSLEDYREAAPITAFTSVLFAAW